MLRAVPAMVRTAASRSAAVRSGVFVFAMSSSCLRLILPTLAVFGVPLPFSRPSALRISTDAGGDEINIIEKGKNYGWGVVSMGLQPGITLQHKDGMVDPIKYYTPAIGPSGITFNTGSKYPGWKNNLFLTALTGQKLIRYEIDGRKITEQEILWDQYGRTRAVIMGPDGLLYVILQNSTGSPTGTGASTPGMVVRLVPQP